MGGIGLLPGSLSVHRSSEPGRLPAYLQAVADQRLPDGYAADDGTALLFDGHRLVECVASQPGRSIVQVRLEGGRPVQQPVPIRLLEKAHDEAATGRFPTPGSESDRVAIEELRNVRAMRHCRS